MTDEEITDALSDPFEPSEVKFRPAAVSGNRAMALAYVDARVIQDRLDKVFGVAGWSDEYQALPNGTFLCKLSCKFGGGWVCKMDVGGESEQQDQGDKSKSAVSDALKRAAVKFGVGRYLYRLPAQWVDYDPHKRQFAKPPQLPASARPAAKPGKDAALKEAALKVLVPASERGTDALKQAWKQLTDDHRKSVLGMWKKIKEDAAAADSARGSAPEGNGHATADR